MLNGELAERIATRWRSQDAHFAEEAETELRDIGPTFETDTGRLGSNAAQALQDHSYRRIEIRVDERDVVMTKTIVDRTMAPGGGARDSHRRQRLVPERDRRL